MDLPKRSVIAIGRLSGKGSSPSATDDGRWVKTMVLILPKRFAREEATSMDPAAMIDVAKKSVPSKSSASPNFSRKK